MMRAGISGRIWGGALRTSVSTKSTNSTPLLCLTSPTTPYSSAFYHLLHCLLPSTHYRLSASRCCIHEYDNMGVNHDKRSGYFRPVQFHSSQKLLIMMLIWLCFDLDHVSYNVDLIKCVFTNKIKISFSPSWHIPKRFNAWKILLDASPRTEGMHSNTIQYNTMQYKYKYNTMHLRGPRECICVADPPARPRASLPPRAYKRCRGWQQASFFSNTNTKSNINTNAKSNINTNTTTITSKYCQGLSMPLIDQVHTEVFWTYSTNISYHKMCYFPTQPQKFSTQICLESEPLS